MSFRQLCVAFSGAVSISLSIVVCALADAPVSIIAPAEPSRPVAYALARVGGQLEARGFTVTRTPSIEHARGAARFIVGVSTEPGTAVELARKHKVALPVGNESLLVQHVRQDDTPTVLVLGGDDRGVMYALLDIAERISWAEGTGDPFASVPDVRETPFVADRAVSVYTMQRAQFESRFFDEEHWAAYFDLLARNRFNRFVLIFGYENWGYFAPPYPYFFNSDQFPDVRVEDFSPQQQQRYTESLRRMIDLCHQRGLEFTVGIWDHIYRGGVQGPREFANRRTPGLVWGVTADNLVPYTKAALAEFLQRFPEIDSVQFRMHWESGLRREEMKEFWSDIFRIVNSARPGMRFDARAKGFPDELIDEAVAQKLNLRITTKYWMEQMGLPFHPLHVHPQNQHDRRHGYADLLRYPKRYDFHWRLWNGGTSRVLLWGDPEYVRRFAASTHLYDGQGFEVNEPLATKMQDHPHDLQPYELLGAQHRYYRWEFERYWHFFQVFGRVSYNPDTPPDVWKHEFQRRFGSQTGAELEQALHRASQILPYLVAFSYPYNHFPTTRGWVEKQRQEDLEDYAHALPSDTELFLSIRDAARNRISGEVSAKVHPLASADWLAAASQDVLDRVVQAEARIGPRRNKEFDSTVTDLRILAHLAEYHSWRVRAALGWAMYEESHDLNSLDDAIDNDERAVAAWRQLVAAAGDFYHDDLMMGRPSAGLSGHWRDELVSLEKELVDLRQLRTDLQPGTAGAAMDIAHAPVRRAKRGADVEIRATIVSAESIAEANLRLRSPDGREQTISMKQTRPFCYFCRIAADRLGELNTYVIEASDASGRSAVFPAEDSPDLTLRVTDDRDPPRVEHQPADRHDAGKPLLVRARVADASGVGQVRLRYRGVNQFFDYHTLPMTAAGDDWYEGRLPAAEINPEWDLMYFIEATDNVGNGTIHPDFLTEQPYVIVRLRRPAAQVAAPTN